MKSSKENPKGLKPLRSKGLMTVFRVLDPTRYAIAKNINRDFLARIKINVYRHILWDSKILKVALFFI